MIDTIFSLFGTFAMLMYLGLSFKAKKEGEVQDAIYYAILLLVFGVMKLR